MLLKRALPEISSALEQAFSTGGARCAYVDPAPENEKALRLYARLGFMDAQRPARLGDPGCPYVYLEMTRKTWEARHGD